MIQELKDLRKEFDCRGCMAQISGEPYKPMGVTLAEYCADCFKCKDCRQYKPALWRTYSGGKASLWCEGCAHEYNHSINLRSRGFDTEHMTKSAAWLDVKQKTIFYGTHLNNQNLYLTGSNGVGKTFLAAQMIIQTPESQLISLPRLFIKIKDGLNSVYGLSLSPILEKIAKCQYVVLDDLREQDATPWNSTIIFSILDIREWAGIMGGLVVTSNLDLDRVGALWGDQIKSRLTRNCRIIELTGEDRRMKRG